MLTIAELDRMKKNAFLVFRGMDLIAWGVSFGPHTPSDSTKTEMMSWASSAMPGQNVSIYASHLPVQFIPLPLRIFRIARSINSFFIEQAKKPLVWVRRRSFVETKQQQGKEGRIGCSVPLNRSFRRR